MKFLGSRKESAERIGVLGVNFFGYEVKLNCPLNDDLHLVKFRTFLDCLSNIVMMKWCRRLKTLLLKIHNILISYVGSLQKSYIFHFCIPLLNFEACLNFNQKLFFISEWCCSFAFWKHGRRLNFVHSSSFISWWNGKGPGTKRYFAEFTRVKLNFLFSWWQSLFYKC